MRSGYPKLPIYHPVPKNRQLPKYHNVPKYHQAPKSHKLPGYLHPPYPNYETRSNQGGMTDMDMNNMGIITRSPGQLDNNEADFIVETGFMDRKAFPLPHDIHPTNLYSKEANSADLPRDAYYQNAEHTNNNQFRNMFQRKSPKAKKGQHIKKRRIKYIKILLTINVNN